MHSKAHLRLQLEQLRHTTAATHSNEGPITNSSNAVCNWLHAAKLVICLFALADVQLYILAPLVCLLFGSALRDAARTDHI